MADPKKVWSKGEIVFKAGEVADKVYLLQSGRIKVTAPRKSFQVEVAQLSAPAIFSEYTLQGMLKHPYSAEVLVPSSIVEIPLATASKVIESSNDLLKLILKNFADTNKQIITQLARLQLRGDPSPCPAEEVPQLFYLLSVFARFHAEKSEPGQSHQVLKWRFVRDFAFKVFHASIERIEGALFILKKLGHVDLIYKMEKQDEADPKEIPTEVLHDILVWDLDFLFDFADYYQTYFYKPGYQHLLKAEEKAIQLCQNLLQSTEGIEVDRKGTMRTTMKALHDYTKSKKLPPFKSDHFELLSQKGLFCKITPTDKDEVFINFDKAEFTKVLRFWQILKEIDLWNERGQVLLVEPTQKEAMGEFKCDAGHSVADKSAKFCPECGMALKKAA